MLTFVTSHAFGLQRIGPFKADRQCPNVRRFFFMQNTNAAKRMRVCRVCKKLFDQDRNGPRACRRHLALFTGRLLRVEPTETSDLTFFYDCCGATSPEAPGCSYGSHESYDD